MEAHNKWAYTGEGGGSDNCGAAPTEVVSWLLDEEIAAKESIFFSCRAGMQVVRKSKKIKRW